MAFATLTFENPRTGQIRQAPVGFSWTTLFFGPLPALMRGHWALAAVIAVLWVFLFIFASAVFAFIYNKMYIKHLMDEGFKVTDTTLDYEALETKLGMRLRRGVEAKAA